MLNVKGNNWLVTGASSGIGKAIAVALAEAGGNLLLIGRNSTRLAETESVCRSYGTEVTTFEIDLTDPPSLTLLLKKVRDRRVPINGIIHAAGMFISGSLSNMQPEKLDHLYLLNVKVPFLLTQALLSLIPQKGGQLIFINSSAALRTAGATTGGYTASKYALTAVTDSFRAELNARNIRVCSIYPGRTATAMQALIYEGEGRIYRPERLLQAEDIASVVVHTLNLPETAEITEINIRPFKKE